jgi:hypothetical protein
MTRKRLPNRRPSRSFDFHSVHLQHRVHVIVGHYYDPEKVYGERGEIFIHGAKTGSTMDCMLHDFATAASLLLQYGGSLAELAKACQRNEDGTAASIFGEVLDHLTANAAKRDAA